MAAGQRQNKDPQDHPASNGAVFLITCSPNEMDGAPFPSGVHGNLT